MGLHSTPKPVARSRKFYLNKENRIWIDEAQYPSKVVNMACVHFKHSMQKLITRLEFKFDAGEIDEIKRAFKLAFDRESAEVVYFSDIVEARKVIMEVNQIGRHVRTRYWRKAYPVLLKHCSCSELNALVYMSRFQELLETNE